MQIEDWEAYCDGESNKDKYDFIGLLTRTWDDEELLRIFKAVPMTDAVVHNLKQVYDNSTHGETLYLRPLKKNAGSSSELVDIVQRFIDTQRRFLLTNEIHEETRTWFEGSLNTEFTSPERLDEVDDDFRQYIREEESEFVGFTDAAGLNITTADCSEYRVMAGIREALYGLATDFYLAWYVLSPILATDIDYELYWQFWVKGGTYALSESAILVARQ